MQAPHPATALPETSWEQHGPMATVWRVVRLQGRGCAAPLSAQQGRWWPGSGSAGDPVASTCRGSHCWRKWGKQHYSFKEEKNE